MPVASKMGWLSVAVIGLSYLAYTVLLSLRALLAIPLFAAAPLVHIGYFVSYGCWWPFHFLAKFETLYIFFGVATLVGIITGTSLHYVSTFLASVLKIDGRPQERRARNVEGSEVGKLEKLEAREPRPEHDTRGR